MAVTGGCVCSIMSASKRCRCSIIVMVSYRRTVWIQHRIRWDIDGHIETLFLPFFFVQKDLGKPAPKNAEILEMTKASNQNRPALVPNPGAKLFDQIREVMRFHHYSYRTEKTYGQWI